MSDFPENIAKRWGILSKFKRGRWEMGSSNSQKVMRSDFSSSFMQNVSCESFPCHKFDDIDNFNCLFCYCPLYAFGERCQGNYTYTEKGIKDCSNCTIPHERKNYETILEKITELYGMWFGFCSWISSVYQYVLLDITIGDTTDSLRVLK